MNTDAVAKGPFDALLRLHLALWIWIAYLKDTQPIFANLFEDRASLFERTTQDGLS
ncbi:hypothetical protein [Neorhizobium petrolearium]|uniref:hypothetical protein n=1 Tax=Neorhizobium petrolearium TaxID=515361 RepID=UPI003F5CC53A